MNSATRLTAAIAILTFALSAQLPAPDPQQFADLEMPQVAVVNATAEQQALVDWALDRYETAQLPIPSVTITFHPSSDGCQGYLGYYDPTATTLDMCNWGQHYKITPASTLLHELAHAWSFEYMTAEDRHEFTNQRGLDHWHHDGPWWHMGQEQAAEIIAWGVGGEDFASVYLSEIDCGEMATSYETMTNRGPLQPVCADGAV